MSASPTEPTAAPGRGPATEWRTSPANHWAFRNVREFLPVAEIGNDPADVAPLSRDIQDLDGFRLTSRDGSVLDLPQFLEATATDGLVILRDGKLVHEAYANGLTAHAPHIVMSMSKAVTGLLVGILRRDGGLDVDAPVSDLVPEVADTAYAGATLRHLMDMRTGVRLDEAQQLAYAAATNWEPTTDEAPLADLQGFLGGLTAPHRPHGGPFSYISANTDLLGWAIERATGRRFSDLVSDHLWKPMGAEDGAYVTVDAHGAPRSTGGICATVRDLARMGQMVLDGGRRGDREVVQEAWLDDILDNGDPTAWREGEFAPAFPGMAMRYRSGWYVIDDAPRTLFAMGVHGQNLFIDPANRLVIAKLSSQDTPFDFRAVSLTHRAVPEFRRVLAG